MFQYWSRVLCELDLGEKAPWKIVGSGMDLSSCEAWQPGRSMRTEHPKKEGVCVRRATGVGGISRRFLLPTTNMGNQQSRSGQRQPKIDFRVLIIGRANAGKTSILQRVCHTTDSPAVYRRIGTGKKKEKVRGQELCNRASLVPFLHRFDLSRPWKSVTLVLRLRPFLIVELARRAHHRG